MMLDEKYLKLDDLAEPDGYAAPSTNEDLAYIAYFRQACKRYNIDFVSANQDERDFVIRMAEIQTLAEFPSFFAKHMLYCS